MDRIERKRAIDTARNDARLLVSSGFLDHGRDWIRAWYRHDLKWSEGDRGYITFPSDKLESLVCEARKCPEVFGLAMQVAGSRLRCRAELPEPLLTLTSEFLSGAFHTPFGKKGRKQNWGRDFIIIRVMKQVLQQHDIPPTANRLRRGVRSTDTSASMILAEAVQEVRGIGHMELERIQKIWGSSKAQADHDDAHGLFLTSLFDDDDDMVRI